MPRTYTRKAPRIKDEDPLAAGGTSRGTNSTRGKKKRASADLDTRTIVASNPFDDDDHHHQHTHQMHANPTHLHQVPLQHQIPNQHPHQAMTPTQHHQHHSPAPMAIQGPYGPPMGVQPAGYPQQPMHGPQRMHQQQHLVEPSMQPGLVGTSTPPPRNHPMYGFQGPTGCHVVSPPPPQQQPPMMHQMEPGQSPVPYQPATQTPIMAYCGECRQAIYASEGRIACRAGCDFYYHRHCSGLTELACDMLLREAAAEWACNRCINTPNRHIPVVRILNQQTDCRQPVW